VEGAPAPGGPLGSPRHLGVGGGGAGASGNTDLGTVLVPRVSRVRREAPGNSPSAADAECNDAEWKGEGARDLEGAPGGPHYSPRHLAAAGGELRGGGTSGSMDLGTVLGPRVSRARRERQGEPREGASPLLSFSPLSPADAERDPEAEGGEGSLLERARDLGAGGERGFLRDSGHRGGLGDSRDRGGLKYNGARSGLRETGDRGGLRDSGEHGAPTATSRAGGELGSPSVSGNIGAPKGQPTPTTTKTHIPGAAGGRFRLGRAVQIDPIKPKFKLPGTKRLILKCEEPLSKFALNFNLRR
jgi:hypothetical protein